jgi:hypothetical protein
MKQILICTDLDRTLLPNGNQPESPAARPLFAKMAAEPFVILAYVSGRDYNLLAQAIKDYNLPEPDFMVGDVGTSIYHKSAGRWQLWEEWQNIISEDWLGTSAQDLAAHLSGLAELTLQEPEKQGWLKLSYYTDPDLDSAALKEKVRSCLGNRSAKVKLVYSVDEVNRIGLFDLLPVTASKLQAIKFLVEKTGNLPERTIYAGDSGNDLEVMTSSIKAILVANATPLVRRQAVEEAPDQSLYLARGNFMNMNGNYAAGILEGLAHYLPELSPLIFDKP